MRPIVWSLLMLAGALGCTTDSLLARNRAERDGGDDSAIRDGRLEAPDAEATDAPYNALAGDGSNAYQKLSNIWCERLFACQDEAQLGRLWADHESRVLEQAHALALDGTDIGCHGENDITVSAGSLISCVKAFDQASCPLLQRYIQPASNEAIYSLAGLQLVDGCSAFLQQAITWDASRTGRQRIGSACTATSRCQDGPCMDGPSGCGICSKLPVQGEVCLDLDNDCVCEFGFTPDASNICQTDGREGDSCGNCHPGLDCDSASKCAQRYKEGDACSAGRSCGTWLTCVDDICRYQFPRGSAVRLVGLGVSCTQETAELCANGNCVDGLCVPRADLGESCDPDSSPDNDPCLRPYLCVGGTCRAPAMPGTGEENEPCDRQCTCAGGLGCFWNESGPGTCTRQVYEQDPATGQASETGVCS